MASGHLEKRSKHGWTLVIDHGRVVDPATKTERQRREYRAVKNCTKTEALAQLHQVLAAINTGSYIKPTSLTVEAYLWQWFGERCESRLAPATVSAYRICIRKYLVPAFGTLPLTGLQPLHLDQQYRRWREEGKGERSVFQAHHVLHTALHQAVRWNLLQRNIADSVDPPRVTPHEMTALSPEQAAQLLEVAKGRTMYALAFVALHTGLRRGELLALRWEDVDLGIGSVRVERILQRVDRKTIIKEPKTAKARRTVPLDEETISVLQEVRAHNAYAYVFAKPDGGPYSPSYVSRAFNWIAKRAGFDMRLHDARHTFASTALAAQVPMRVVQELVGHKNLATTADLYTHVLQNLKTDAAKAIGDAYKSGERQMSSRTATGGNPSQKEPRP